MPVAGRSDAGLAEEMRRADIADSRLWAARAIAQEIGRYGHDLDAQVARTAEAVVLPQAAELCVNRLRFPVRNEVVRHDAEAADRRRRQAAAAADVFLRRSAPDGMTEVVTVVPRPVAAALFRTVDACAHQAEAGGDVRRLGQIRAEVMTDPAASDADGRPTGVAAVDDEPITAAHLRALLTALDSVCPGGLQRRRVERCTSTCWAAEAGYWPP